MSVCVCFEFNAVEFYCGMCGTWIICVLVCLNMYECH